MEKIYTWRVPQGPAQFPVFPTGLNEHPEIHIKWGHFSNVLHLGEHLVNYGNFESHIHSNWESESEVAQSCLTLCDSMDCSLTGSSIHGIFQARILEWAAISFSRRSSQPRDWTWVSRIVDICFIIWATSNWEEETNVRGVGGRQRGLGMRLTLPYMKSLFYALVSQQWIAEFFFSSKNLKQHPSSLCLSTSTLFKKTKVQ